ncbi:MAG: toxin-antitoxin system YwqK family antitoxin [Fusobacteriaceae bacterium]
MKKMKIVIGVLLLTLIGCTPLEKNQSIEERILLPTMQKQAHNVKVSTMKEGNFIPQTDIIHSKQNVALADSSISEFSLNGVDQVNMAKKRVRNKLTYNQESTVPFTGTFVAVIGVHKYYTEEFKDGKLNGYKVWYSEAGRVGMKEPYSDGLKNGVQETYYRNTGNIRSRVTYSGGRISGPMSWYDKSGNLINNEDFKGGNGEWIAYWDNGEVREKGRLASGLPNGEWKYFNIKGEVTKVATFRNGSPISQEWFK